MPVHNNSDKERKRQCTLGHQILKESSLLTALDNN